MKTAPWMIRYIIKYSMAPAAILISMGCTVGPDYKKPQVTMPQEFRTQVRSADASSIADMPWWHVFEDEELQGLIRKSLANNYDLKVAIARIEQARSVVKVTRSASIPQIGYNAFGGAERTFAPQEESVETVGYSTFGGVLNAVWEVDMWGRIRRSTESAMAILLAQEDVRHGIILTLISDVAANYFQLIELDRELAIAEESSGTYKRTHSLFSDRFEAGKDSDLAVQRVLAAYNSSIATVESIKRQIVQQENAISILLGEYPRGITRGQTLTKQVLPTTPIGATTDILQRRPDIMQAEHVMISANADIGVAVANFYPRVGLSTLIGAQAADVSEDFSSFGIGSAIANVTGPIFTGGRLQAIYIGRQAFWDESVAQYKKSVLNAFRETSDVLAAEKTLVNQRAALQKQVDALRSSVDLSLLRYDGGRSSYFEVLEAQQQLFPPEAAFAQTRRDQLIAVVNLYKALGGGWKSAEASNNSNPKNQNSISTGGK
jgi:multidrug efflux system outer membrane protein